MRLKITLGMQAVLALAALSLSPLANSATITWDDGAVGTSWSSAGNWNPDQIPTTGDDAIIGDGVTVYSVSGNISISPDSLTVKGNASVNLGASLSGPVPVTIENGGSWRVAGGSRNGFDLTLQDGARLAVGTSGQCGFGNTVTVAPGTAILGEGTTSSYAWVRGAVYGTGNLDVILDGPTHYIAMPGSVATYSGNVSIEIGILALDRNLGPSTLTTGNITVAPGAILRANHHTYEGMPFSDTTRLTLEKSGSTYGRFEMTDTWNADAFDTVDSMVLGGVSVPPGVYTMEDLNTAYGPYFSENYGGTFTFTVLNAAGPCTSCPDFIGQIVDDLCVAGVPTDVTSIQLALDELIAAVGGEICDDGEPGAGSILDCRAYLETVLLDAATTSFLQSLLGSGGTFAADVTWDGDAGTGNKNWTTASNWSGDATPGPGQTAEIGNVHSGSDALAAAPLPGGDPDQILVAAGAQLQFGDNANFANGTLADPLEIIVDGEIRTRRSPFENYRLTLRSGSEVLFQVGANSVGKITQYWTVAGTTTFGEGATNFQFLAAKLVGSGDIQVVLDDPSYNLAYLGGQNPGYSGNLFVEIGTFYLSRGFGQSGEFTQGNVTVASGAILDVTYQTNETQAFSDTTRVTIETGGLLRYSSANFGPETETVDSMILGGTVVAPGVYTADDLNTLAGGTYITENFPGDLTITVLNGVGACSSCPDIFDQVLAALCAAPPASASGFAATVDDLLTTYVTGEICDDGEPGAGSAAACSDYIEDRLLSDVICDILGALAP